MQYQVGASLPPNAPSYVVRQADRDFYNALKAGEFCYVLNSRQMGKSSLRVRTMRRLQTEDFVCIALDLTLIGSHGVTLEQWYATVVKSIADGCPIPLNFSKWWRDRLHLSPLGRFQEFIESVLLTEIEKDIVIFMDEIDSVLSLGFSADDFFAFIRACYNQRTDDPNYKRLTFAFLGVATPPDLIQDKQRTPFNIASKIELKGFQLQEATPLIQGLKGKVSNPDAVLQAILSWTGGQPFLTQKLCKLVHDAKLFIPEGAEAQQVELLVRSRVIENWESQDEPEHLKTIRDRLTSRQQITIGILSLYQKILNGAEIAVDHSQENMELLLSGVVVKQDKKLKLSNRIYESIFNLVWVEKSLEDRRPYAQNLVQWLDSSYQDKSCLLQGEELQRTLKWMKSKILGSQDFEFLKESQNLEIQKVQQSFKEAEQQLLEVHQKIKRRVRWGGIILALSLLGSITAIVISASNNLKNQINALNSSAKTLFSSNLLSEALMDSLQAGRLLETTDMMPRDLKSGTTHILQQIVNVIQQPILEGHKGEIYGVSFSPDGQTIATASEDQMAKLWNLKGKNIQTLKGHADRVWHVRFSPDGKTIATASWDGTIRLWNWNGQYSRSLGILRDHKGWVFDVSFSPDGKTLASVGGDKIIRLWNLESNTLLHKWNSKHGKNVVNVSFSPDGKIIATASDDHTAKLWSQDGILRRTLKGHTNEVNGVSFSPDGKIIATASDDHTAKLWDLKGKELQTLRGHAEQVISVSFSSDGKTIATGSFDRTVKLWGFNGLLKQTLFPKHEGWVWDANFSPDGKILASASRDATVRLWSTDISDDSPLKDLLKKGCNALGKHPTSDLEKNKETIDYCRKQDT
jgi:WD40 repeat protein